MHTCHILNNIEARELLVLSHAYCLSLFSRYCDGPIVVISLCFGKIPLIINPGVFSDAFKGSSAHVRSRFEAVVHKRFLLECLGDFYLNEERRREKKLSFRCCDTW